MLRFYFVTVANVVLLVVLNEANVVMMFDTVKDVQNILNKKMVT